MPFIHIPTGAIVDRTFEDLSGGCTIARAEGQPLGWDYDGTGPDVFWDDSQPMRDAQGETLYLTETGAIVPHSQVGWQDEDDAGTPAPGTPIVPLPPEREHPEAATCILRLAHAERDIIADALKAAAARGTNIPPPLVQMDAGWEMTAQAGDKVGQGRACPRGSGRRECGRRRASPGPLPRQTGHRGRMGNIEHGSFPSPHAHLTRAAKGQPFGL